MSATLFLVATPIGHLQDITLRALETLRAADAIACEDTRVTNKLLAYFGIQRPLISLHEHSNALVFAHVLRRIKAGESIAYVTDAGTPGISDPGGKLVMMAAQSQIKVIPIPGASSLTTAMSVCGFPMRRFVFEGFLPIKKGKKKILTEIATRKEPTIFFESTHRILKTLSALREILPPDREIFCGREMTKLYETYLRGTMEEVMQRLYVTSTKGEFVVIIGPPHMIRDL